MKRDISRHERLTVLVRRYYNCKANLLKYNYKITLKAAEEPSRVNLGNAAVRGGGGLIHCSLIQDAPGQKYTVFLSEFLNPFASKNILQIISICQKCICYVSQQYLAIASVCDQ